MKLRPNNRFVRSLALFSPVILAGSAFAQKVYDNGGGDGLWNTPANWSGDTIPSSTDTATFNNPALTSVRLDGAVGYTSGITFANGTGFTIGNASGDTAKLAPAGKTFAVNDAGVYTINFTNGTGTGNAGNGAFEIGAGAAILTTNVGSTGKLVFDGRYYGSNGAVRSVTKSGTGTLELKGDYTGTFLQANVSAGTLALNGSGTNHRLFGTSQIAAAGTLRIDSANANLFTGTSSLHASSGLRLFSGTLDLNGFNTATTRIQGTAATAVVTNNGTSDAVLTLGDFGTTTGLAATITTTSFSGTIQDGATNKVGLSLVSGTSPYSLVLSGAATYTGPTTISNGASLDAAKGISGASPVTVNAGTLTLGTGLANTGGITVNTGGILSAKGDISTTLPLTFAGSALRPGGASATAAVLSAPSVSHSAGSVELDVTATGSDKVTTGSYNHTGGDLKVALQGSPSTAAPYTLIEYGTLTGAPPVSFSPPLAQTRYTATVDPGTGTSDEVTVSFSGAAANLAWAGIVDGNWDRTTVNWSDGIGLDAFRDLDNVTFGDASGIFTVNVGGTVTPGSITVNATDPNTYTIDGTGTIAGAAGGLTKSSSGKLILGGNNIFVGPVTLLGGVVQLNTNQALGFTSGLKIYDGSSLDLFGKAPGSVNRSYLVELGGNGADGSGGIVNTGAAVSSSGLREITLTDDASIGGTGAFELATGGKIVGNGFTLRKQGANDITINGPVENGYVNADAGGYLTLSHAGAYGLGLTVSTGGKARTGLGGTFNTPVTLLDGGLLENFLGGDSTFAGPLTLVGTPIFGTTNTSSLIIASDFDADNGFIVTRPGGFGSGIVQILGANTVGGTVSVTNGGQLQLGNGGTTGSIGTAPVSLTSGTFRITRSDNLTVANPISGTGTFTKAGANTVRYVGTASGTFTTTVPAGTLIIGDGATTGSLSGNLSVSDGAVATFDRTDDVPFGGTLTGAGAARTAVINKNGAGSLSLNVTGGTYNANINVTGGSLVFNATNATPSAANSVSVNLAPGTTLTNGTTDHNHLRNVTLSNATWTTGSGTTSYSGENYQLNGDVTVTGIAPSLITRDAVRTNADSGVSLRGNRTFNVADVTSSAATDLLVSTELEASDDDIAANQSALTKTGAGTLELTIDNSYTGGTTVNAGTVVVSNTTGSGTGTGAVAVNNGGRLAGGGAVAGAVNVNAGGTLAPAATGTLAAGATTFVSGATLATGIDSAGTTSSALKVNGALTLGGATLAVADTAASPSALPDGTKLTLVNYTGQTLTGTFNGLAEGATVTVAGHAFTLSYADTLGGTGNFITLTAGSGSATPFDTWIGGYPSLTDPNDRLPTADPDHDGRSNLLEFALGGNPTSGSDPSVAFKIGDPDGAGPDIAAAVMTLPVRAGASFLPASAGALEATIDGVTYRIEGSPDLVNWNLQISEVTPNASFVPSLPAPTGWTYRSFRTAGEASAASKAFLRLKTN